MKSSTASSDAFVATPVKQSPSDAPIGLLWSMRRSPFSFVVKIVLHLSARTAHSVTYMPLFSTVTMYIRLFLHSSLPSNHKVSSPVFRTLDEPPRYLLDSFDIARYIDEHRKPSSHTLFPVAHLPSLEKFNAHAASINSFMRARLLAQLRDDPSLGVEMYLPRALRRPAPIARLVVRVAVGALAWRYGRESRTTSRMRVREALLDVRAALAAHEGADLRYLVAGRLSFADVVVAESIFFDMERHARFGRLYADSGFADEFADVVAWARAIRQTHYESVLPKKR